jgi:hypothetical protein
MAPRLHDFHAYALRAALRRVARAFPEGTRDRFTPEQEERAAEIDEILNAALLSGDAWAIDKSLALWERVWRKLILEACSSVPPPGIS